MYIYTILYSSISCLLVVLLLVVAVLLVVVARFLRPARRFALRVDTRP